MSEPFFTSSAGVRHYWDDTPEGPVIRSEQDVAPALEATLAMRNENDGYSPSRDLRRVGHLPAVIILKWLQEEGWNAMNPHHHDRLVKKLNDPDWAYLRTAPGQIGYTNGVMR